MSDGDRRIRGLQERTEPLPSMKGSLTQGGSLLLTAPGEGKMIPFLLIRGFEAEGKWIRLTNSAAEIH